MLDNGAVKLIFDHLRNYLMCSLLLAIGVTELKHNTNQFFDLIPSNYSGIGIIALSCVLISLNLYDGVRQISKSKYHYLFTLCLVLLYLFISLRVIDLAWSYRAW